MQKLLDLKTFCNFASMKQRNENEHTISKVK